MPFSCIIHTKRVILPYVVAWENALRPIVFIIFLNTCLFHFCFSGRCIHRNVYFSQTHMGDGYSLDWDKVVKKGKFAIGRWNIIHLSKKTDNNIGKNRKRQTEKHARKTVHQILKINPEPKHKNKEKKPGSIAEKSVKWLVTNSP